MNHATIWAAIDRVAIRLRMTRSGLARHCWSHNQRSRTRLGPTERRRHRCVTGLLVTRDSLLVSPFAEASGDRPPRRSGDRRGGKRVRD